MSYCAQKLDTVNGASLGLLIYDIIYDVPYYIERIFMYEFFDYSFVLSNNHTTLH